MEGVRLQLRHDEPVDGLRHLEPADAGLDDDLESNG
jgi:hypothetical protein